jgi:hypothetical protein
LRRRTHSQAIAKRLEGLVDKVDLRFHALHGVFVEHMAVGLAGHGGVRLLGAMNLGRV